MAHTGYIVNMVSVGVDSVAKLPFFVNWPR